MGDPFSYRTHAEGELYNCLECDSGQRLSKQTHYDWKKRDDGMKAENEIYPCAIVHNV